MIHCLEIDGVFFEINNKMILSNIYLECKTETITGLFGKNGSGKSCLMKIIFGSLECENSVRFDKKSIKNLKKRNELITHLPQFNFIPKNLSLKKIFYYFELSLNKFLNSFPEFATKYNTKLNELSGGERRFVELYTILFSKSKFVLLDEPFTHLSPFQIEKAKQLILEAKSTKGILISDHLYQHILDISDTIYVLTGGRTCVANSLLDIESLGYFKLNK